AAMGNISFLNCIGTPRLITYTIPVYVFISTMRPRRLPHVTERGLSRRRPFAMLSWVLFSHCMLFQILSHAGLLVQGAGKTLVCDPWLVGSAYWRSWWNYPPVPRGLAESLRPDFIYLTHVHWDHFHGPTLRKFPRDT